MPIKEKNTKAKLTALIAEQAKDAGSTCIFPERIKPQKPPLPFNLTPTQYFHLILTESALTIVQIAEICNVTPDCVSLHRWNAYRKLGPEMLAQWKKVSQLFKTHSIFCLPASGSPPSVSESGELDQLD